jgi:hypothetical protein
VTTCACSDTAPQLTSLTAANTAVAAAGDAGICGTIGYEVSATIENILVPQN